MGFSVFVRKNSAEYTCKTHYEKIRPEFQNNIQFRKMKKGINER